MVVLGYERSRPYRAPANSFLTTCSFLIYYLANFGYIETRFRQRCRNGLTAAAEVA